MTIIVSEFWLGVLATIGIEVGASFLILLYFTLRYSLKSRKDASKSLRNNDNE